MRVRPLWRFAVRKASYWEAAACFPRQTSSRLEAGARRRRACDSGRHSFCAGRLAIKAAANRAADGLKARGYPACPASRALASGVPGCPYSMTHAGTSPLGSNAPPSREPGPQWCGRRRRGLRTKPEGQMPRWRLPGAEDAKTQQLQKSAASKPWT